MKLVYTVSGGAAFVTPYEFRTENAGTRMPLNEGKPYALDAYLTWLGTAPAETTAAN